MRRAYTLGHDDRGFTIVELMVAVSILMVGILGVMTMADIGNRNQRETNSHVAATNLAREVAEDARSIDYDRLTPDFLAPELQRKPGLEGAGNPWTVERRNVTYTIAVSVCAFDDPRDGLAAAGNGPQNPCPNNAIGASDSKERNGDDFRRVQIDLSWVRDGRQRSLTETEMVVNPAGSLGPRIITFEDPVGQITAGSVVTLPVKTTDAAAVHWTVESVDSGDATGGRRDWSISWNLGLDPADPAYVHDGVYTMAAQAFDRNIAGDARFVTIMLNRREPLPAPGLAGGRNQRHGGIVDVRWDPSVEPDVRRYRLYRISSTGARILICEKATTQRLSCHDNSSPLPMGTLTYHLVAMDLQDLGAAASSERESSTPAILNVAADPGPEPPTPSQPTVSLINNGSVPSFDWTQAQAESVIFWRVYRREGVHTGRPTLADRWTTTGIPHYEDTAPRNGPVTYWFSAVHSSFNESPATTALTVNL